MEQNFKIAVPEGCMADIKQENGFLVVTFEPKKWEPKDGDILSRKGTKALFILRKKVENNAYCYAGIDIYGNLHLINTENVWTTELEVYTPATEEEKQRLFDALAKEGKRWNAEEKRIEDLPRWRANLAEFYFYIEDDLSIGLHSDIRDGMDESYYKLGNYFKTREAAEKVAKQIREIFKESKAE